MDGLSVRSQMLRRVLWACLPVHLLLLTVPAWADTHDRISHSAQDLTIETPSTQPIASVKSLEREFSLTGAALQPSFEPALVLDQEPAIAQALESPPASTPEAVPETPEGDTPAPATPTPTPSVPEPAGQPSDLEKSPTYQKWRQQVPNVLEDIKNDPSFRTRVRLGLSYFPSTSDSLGWNVGVEDVFLGRTHFTLSGDYQATFSGDRKAGGAELRYYVLPLGGYVNLTPILGYRYLETPRYVTDGLNVGLKAQFVLSRTGGADIAFTQTWVAPQQSDEVGITKFSFGYALTKSLRLSTDIEKQNSKQKKDTRFGLSVEWMF